MTPGANADSNSNGYNNRQQHGHPLPFVRSLGYNVAGDAFLRGLLIIAVSLGQTAIVRYLWGCIGFDLCLWSVYPLDMFTDLLT